MADRTASEIAELKNTVRCLLVSVVVSLVIAVTSVVCSLIMFHFHSVAINALPPYITAQRRTQVLHLSLDTKDDLTIDEGNDIIRLWKSEQNVKFAVHDDGTITVKDDGLYLIYIQLSFEIQEGKLSYAIFLDNGDHEFLKCTWAESGISSPWLSPCHTSRAAHLNAGQQLHVKVIYAHKQNVLLNALPSLTFWGLLQMG